MSYIFTIQFINDTKVFRFWKIKSYMHVIKIKIDQVRCTLLLSWIRVQLISFLNFETSTTKHILFVIKNHNLQKKTKLHMDLFIDLIWMWHSEFRVYLTNLHKLSVYHLTQSIDLFPCYTNYTYQNGYYFYRN